MAEKLRQFGRFILRLPAVWRATRHEYALLEDEAYAAAERPWEIGFLLEKWLIYSTVFSLFLGMLLIHKGIDIFVGYPIVVLNSAILLVTNRLLIHRNHLIFIAVIFVVSLVASRFSGTPPLYIMKQIPGILVFSVYYFSIITVSGLTVPQWMRLYCHMALGIAIWAIVDFLMRKLHMIHQVNDPRLHWYWDEPSFFTYLMLPALSLYLGGFLRTGRHKPELAIFAVAFVFADSSLGFLGLLVVAFFAFLPRITLWRTIWVSALATAGMTAAFFASTNFRLRVVDTFLGITLGDFQHVNASTFAILANGYVTFLTFLKYPIFGVGLGGYPLQYEKYLPHLNNDDPTISTLNIDDASSLFFRTTSELGLFGITCLVGFLVICSRVKGDTHVEIRNAIMCFFILRMGRYGAYFSVDLYFFVCIFLLNYLSYRQQLKNPPRRTALSHAV